MTTIYTVPDNPADPETTALENPRQAAHQGSDRPVATSAVAVVEVDLRPGSRTVQGCRISRVQGERDSPR